MPTEGRRLHEFVTGVLGNGRLQVSKAEAAINVAAGQARFSNIVLGAKGADLELTASVDLATATLDALLTLSGSPASEGAARPALLVALKGALPAPRRAIDASLLASWLTLRAVEQQSRQIDAMEKAVRDAPPQMPASGQTVTPPPEPDTTSSTRGQHPPVDQEAPSQPADRPAARPRKRAASRQRAAAHAPGSGPHGHTTARASRRAELTKGSFGFPSGRVATTA
jgi:large subunit ribosomal protein L24